MTSNRLALNAYSVETTQGTVHYTEAGDGPAIVFIHGSLCDYRYWRWQIAELKSAFRVLAPSLRGYWPQPYRVEEASFGIDQHTADLAAFLDAVVPKAPVHVLGHSRGARVALELACKRPDQVRSLTLADPGFRLRGEPAVPAAHVDDALTALQHGDTEGALERFIDTVSGMGTWRQMVAWFKTMVRDNAYTLLSQARELNDAGVDIELVKQRLGCPLLLVGGAHSPRRYGERLDALARAFPNARTVIVPHASHGMNLANPKAFNQALRTFISDLAHDADVGKVGH